eukprot:m.13132 g.13132  ORF g.13132 m.13132 type:complete len:72 (-) comp10044_c0_seq1:46-261(-)
MNHFTSTHTHVSPAPTHTVVKLLLAVHPTLTAKSTVPHMLCTQHHSSSKEHHYINRLHLDTQVCSGTLTER